MKARIYRVTFRPEDIACTPPCGMEATLNSIDEMIRSILSRHADESTDNKLRLRFGRNDVEIKNGLVKIYHDSERDTEKIIAILKLYFSVRETHE